MSKKCFTFLALMLFFADILADTVEIDVPEVTFKVKNGFTIPNIEGFDLDGTGEETILPFKRMVFGSAVTKVEIVKKHEITLEAPLKKGGALYRLSDMRKVVTAPSEKRVLPTLSRFTFDRKSSFKRDNKLFSLDFYPIVPAAGNKVVKIDRIRVTTKGNAFLPMAEIKNRDSLLILTTEYFLSESEQLENYIKAKRESGFRVAVVTEKDYGGGDLKGIKRVEKIRKYLKEIYKDYEFLLIIAYFTGELPKSENRNKPVGSSPKGNKEKESFKVKVGKRLLESAEKQHIQFKPVEKLSQPLEENQIIKKLGGFDRTGGSCSSLALAYIGNKSGLDVTDYRGGSSKEFFASWQTIFDIANLVGGEIIINQEREDIIKHILPKIKKGKEYYFAYSSHAAIVKNDFGLKYLEMQTNDFYYGNVFHRLDETALHKRFRSKADKSSRANAVLIDIDKLKKDETFQKLLGYLNTAESEQKKGTKGLRRK